VHELCHLREPSHWEPFWHVVAAARPCWPEHVRSLRGHGQELHNYEPARGSTIEGEQ
jgi:predicted metal-dependent hydrolase